VIAKNDSKAFTIRHDEQHRSRPDSLRGSGSGWRAARPGSSTYRACVRRRLVQGITKREDSSMRLTIVLVHGAFADSSNWDVETSCT
jgi:pimeloyl-ACP methyl ester carboxylesterase